MNQPKRPCSLSVKSWAFSPLRLLTIAGIVRSGESRTRRLQREQHFGRRRLIFQIGPFARVHRSNSSSLSLAVHFSNTSTSQASGTPVASIRQCEVGRSNVDLALRVGVGLPSKNTSSSASAGTLSRKAGTLCSKRMRLTSARTSVWSPAV